METTTIGLIGLGVMIILILAGVHIGIAMAIAGFAGFAVIVNWTAAFGVLQTAPYSTVANYSLSVIILFVLMGQILSYSGLSKDLYDAANTWLGHLKGGMAMATVVACALVGSLCGATTATTATMGIVALPAMKEYKYNHGLAAASVACAGTLSCMVPPSVLLMLYGVMTSQSIGKLFTAVIVPGLFLALFFMIAIYIKIKRNPEMGPPGQSHSWKEKGVALYKIKDTLAVIVLVIGGIFSGLCTVYEAGAVGVVGVLIAAGLRGKLNKTMLINALLDTGKIVAMIFMIIIGAMILGYFFAVTQLPTNLANFFANLPLERHVILAGIVVLYIFLGAIMDEMAMLLLTVPIFFPVILKLGFDPVWFGVMICLIMASGMICPPVGINCFIIAGVDKSIPLHQIYKGILPFWFSILLMMILITIFPQLCTFLPNYLFPSS